MGWKRNSSQGLFLLSWQWPSFPGEKCKHLDFSQQLQSLLWDNDYRLFKYWDQPFSLILLHIFQPNPKIRLQSLTNCNFRGEHLTATILKLVITSALVYVEAREWLAEIKNGGKTRPGWAGRVFPPFLMTPMILVHECTTSVMSDF